MDTSENPVKAARKRLKLSRAALASVIGRGASTLQAAESGYLVALPADWAPGLAAVGLDHAELAAAYLEWRRIGAARLTAG